MNGCSKILCMHCGEEIKQLCQVHSEKVDPDTSLAFCNSECAWEYFMALPCVGSLCTADRGHKALEVLAEIVHKLAPPLADVPEGNGLASVDPLLGALAATLEIPKGVAMTYEELVAKTCSPEEFKMVVKEEAPPNGHAQVKWESTDQDLLDALAATLEIPKGDGAASSATYGEILAGSGVEEPDKVTMTAEEVKAWRERVYNKAARKNYWEGGD